MSPLVESLISTLIPILVAEAESLLGSKPDPSNHAWIVGLVNEVVSLLDKSLPSWIRPSEEAVKSLVEDAIAKLVSKA